MSKNLITLCLLLTFAVNLKSQLDISWDLIRQDKLALMFKTISHTSDEGFILLTSTDSDGQFEGSLGGRDAYIAKYNEQGVLKWDEIIGGCESDEFNTLAITSDEGFILAGNYGLERVIIKINDSGQVEWAKGELAWGSIISVKVDGQDNIYTSRMDENGNLGKITLTKYDSEGNKLWDDPIEIGPGLAITDVTFDQNDNVYRLSYIASGFNESKIAITKFDSDGNEIWRRFYGGNGYNIGNVLEVKADQLILAGRTNSNSGEFISENGDYDAFVASIDLEGNVMSYTAFGGSDYEGVDDMEIVGDRIFISGQSYSIDSDFDIPNPGSADIYIVELNLDGSIVWKEYSGGSKTESSSDIAILNDTALVLGYRSLSQDGTLDGSDEGLKTYIAYYNFQDIVNINNLSKIDFTIYPNPTSEKIIISIEDYHNYGIKIYSINGLLLKTMDRIDNNEIDISNLPSGLLKISLCKNGIVVNSKSIYKD